MPVLIEKASLIAKLMWDFFPHNSNNEFKLICISWSILSISIQFLDVNYSTYIHTYRCIRGIVPPLFFLTSSIDFPPSSTSDFRNVPTTGVNRGARTGGGFSVQSQRTTTTQSGMEPRWRVSITWNTYWCGIHRYTEDGQCVAVIWSSIPSSLQGPVPWRRPPRGVSGRWPVAEGEVSQTEGPGALPVSGQ